LSNFGAATESGVERAGFWFALTAYGLWGVLPVYFKLVGFAAPFEIISHRIVWALLVLVLWVLGGGNSYQRKLKEEAAT
jgi:EamA domain-containing membrane protein RarD